MCTSWVITYTCGCQRDLEFEQCAERQGTNVKCSPIIKDRRKTSANHCSQHLVKPDASVKYKDQAGDVMPVD